MDEPRDLEPGDGTRRTAVVGRAALPPPQEAWRLYVEHAGTCKDCRDVDRGACTESTRLYQAWQGIAADALREAASGGRGRY